MNRRLEGTGGAIFMIGIGLIFLLNLPFWPWILAVIGAASFPQSVARKGFLGALQGAMWFGGIIYFVMSGNWFPGILILIGLSSLIETMTRGSRPRGEKAKRELPPDEDDYEEKAKRGLSLDELIDYGRTNDGEIYIPDEDERETRYS